MPNYGHLSLSVLKSNGLRHSKNPPVKSNFSLKIVPATIAKKLPPQRCSKPFLIPIFNFSHKRPTFAFTGESATHSAFGEKSHTAAYTPKQGAFRMGVVSLLSERSARSPTSPGRVSERQVLPLLGLGRVLPKNAESLRNSDALMRVAVPRRRGPAGLHDLFVSDEITVFTPCVQGFPRVRDMGGITTLGVLFVLLKRRTAACQSG